MTDLGPIPILLRRERSHTVAPADYGVCNGQAFMPVLDLTCVISGKVFEEDGTTPVPFARVSLHNRASRRVVAHTSTNSAGEFSFSGLLPNPQRYFAIAFHPDGTPTSNALIFDRLTAETPGG